MTISVFRLIKIPGFSNSFGVNRSEEWDLRLVKNFSSISDAREFVREQHRGSSAFLNLVVDVRNDKIKTAFLDEFSFHNDLYTLQREYFIGNRKDILQKLRQLLKQDGIVIKD